MIESDEEEINTPAVMHVQLFELRRDVEEIKAEVRDISREIRVLVAVKERGMGILIAMGALAGLLVLGIETWIGKIAAAISNATSQK